MAARDRTPATADPLAAFLDGVDPAVAPAVTALDEVVRAAHSGFDVAIKYHMLTYALDGDWRTWVCAIDATRKGAVAMTT